MLAGAGSSCTLLFQSAIPPPQLDCSLPARALLPRAGLTAASLGGVARLDGSKLAHVLSALSDLQATGERYSFAVDRKDDSLVGAASPAQGLRWSAFVGGTAFDAAGQHCPSRRMRACRAASVSSDDSKLGTHALRRPRSANPSCARQALDVKWQPAGMPYPIYLRANLAPTDAPPVLAAMLRMLLGNVAASRQAAQEWEQLARESQSQVGCLQGACGVWAVWQQVCICLDRQLRLHMPDFPVPAGACQCTHAVLRRGQRCRRPAAPSCVSWLSVPVRAGGAQPGPGG